MFQPLLDAFIESAPIKKKLPLNLPPPPLKKLVPKWGGALKKLKKAAFYLSLIHPKKTAPPQTPNEPPNTFFAGLLVLPQKIQPYKKPKSVF